MDKIFRIEKRAGKDVKIEEILGKTVTINIITRKIFVIETFESFQSKSVTSTKKIVSFENMEGKFIKIVKMKSRAR